MKSRKLFVAELIFITLFAFTVLIVAVMFIGRLISGVH